jgi:anti-sigma-K factor RskA
MSPGIHELTGAYVTHSLPDWEEREFLEHLATCAACATEVRELEATTARIGWALAAARPPDMKTRVLAQIARTPQLPPLQERETTASAQSASATLGADDAGTPQGDDRSEPVLPGLAPAATHRVPRAGRASRRRWMQVLAAAASVVLLVAVAVLGANNVALRNQVDELEAQRETVERILTAADATVATAEANGRSGRVVISASQDAGVFFASGLAPAPEGQTYQGWLRNSANEPRSAGLFLPGPDGTAILVLSGDLQEARAFGVTLEPEGGSPQPTGLPPLLAIPLQP